MYMKELSHITTTDQLVQLLQKNNEEKDADLSTLRYAIYLRKSTDDPEKQVRSVEDQKTECMKLAQANNIFVLEENIIEEKESAKEPGIRPKFRRLLDRVISGELDGIIAWHPDRLSRNMREAGEIIDLLDKNIIKGLKFVSHNFTNDPSGKMLLGIVFVMAKQYSDQLSTNVKRGNKNSIESGSYINKSKHGYYKDINQRLQPDGNNFVLLKEAFLRRLQGMTLQNIADFLNDSSYERRNTQTSKPKKTKFIKQTLSKIFSDPIYAGINHYGKDAVDLTKIYDFIPIINVQEYIQINKFDPLDKNFSTKKAKRDKKVLKADLLNNKVICDHCDETMSAGISKGKTKNYYYFRCNTNTCEMYNKNVRAKVIKDFVLRYLEFRPFSSQEAYQSYKKEILRIQNQGTHEINSEIASLKRNIGIVRSDIEDVKRNLAKETDVDLINIQKEELKRLKEEEIKNGKKTGKLQEKKINVSKAPLAFEEFIEVIDSLPSKIKKVQTTTQLDSILAKIFLNFSVRDRKVVNYTLKAPFGALERVNDSEVNNGGDGGI